MGKKLTKAPVYYTVVQVQFNSLLGLGDRIQNIQAKMREMQFPVFQKQVLQQLDFPVLNTQGAQALPPTITTQTRYLFGNIRGQSAFLLEDNSLTFQTSAYDTFETFSRTFIAALEALHLEFGLDFTERIGLRYLDAIQPSGSNETLRDFLVPEVLGLSAREHGKFQQSISETVISIEPGKLTSRVIIRQGQVGLPMELTGVSLDLAPRFLERQGLHAIVDTDASLTHREAFDLTAIERRLTDLHDEIDASFKAIVTDSALESWA